MAKVMQKKCFTKPGKREITTAVEIIDDKSHFMKFLKKRNIYPCPSQHLANTTG